MARKFDIKIDTIFDKGDSEIFQFKFSGSSFIAICKFFCQNNLCVQFWQLLTYLFSWNAYQVMLRTGAMLNCMLLISFNVDYCLTLLKTKKFTQSCELLCVGIFGDWKSSRREKSSWFSDWKIWKWNLMFYTNHRNKRERKFNSFLLLF